MWNGPRMNATAYATIPPASQPWLAAMIPVLERVGVADTGVVVEMPDLISRSPHVETKDKVRVFDYGNLRDEPIVVELVVAALPSSVPDEQLDGFLHSLQSVMQSAALPDAQRQGDARIVTVGARRFVSTTHAFKNRVTLQSWGTALGDRQVILRVYSLPDRPASWAGIEDRIVASLQRP